MSSTTFTNGVTLTDEDWFNDLNRLHYTIFSDPADLAAAFARITGLSADTAGIASADEILFYDASDATSNKTTFVNAMKGINTFTEETAPNGSADFMLIYSTSAGAARKVKPNNVRIAQDWFHADKNGSNQGSIGNGADTKLTFTNEVADTGSVYNSTDSRVVPPNGQRWLLTAVARTTGGTDAEHHGLAIYKNGSLHLRGIRMPIGAGSNTAPMVTCIVEGNGTDYYEVFYELNNSAGQTVSGTATQTYYQGIRVG